MPKRTGSVENFSQVTKSMILYGTQKNDFCSMLEPTSDVISRIVAPPPEKGNSPLSHPNLWVPKL